jgi:O-antigen/teichoic acid export membrane protein
LLTRLAGRTPPGTVNPVPPGVRVVTPRVLPPAGPLRALNLLFFTPALARQLRREGLEPGARLIAYFPTATTLDLIRRLSPSVVVYDCASNFRAHPDAPADIKALERRLIRRAALVVTDSDFLYQQKRAEHPRVEQIHQGVASEFFSAKPANPAFRRLCSYGSWVADLDPAYLIALADAGFDVTISGFLRCPPPQHPGIHVLGPVPREKLVERLEGFDAFLFPHRINEFMRGVVPAKLYECLAMGRPVLAAPLPSIMPYKDLLHIAGTPEEWVELAKRLPDTETGELRARRIALARRHSHESEFARLQAAMDEAAGKPGGSEAPKRGDARMLEYLRGFGWIGLLFTASRMLTLATQVLAGRLMGPIEYGKANLVSAAAAMLQVLPILGFPTALAKFPAEQISEGARGRLISSSLAAFGLWLLISAAAIAALPDRAFSFFGLLPSLAHYAAALAFATAVYTVTSSPLLGLRRFRERGLTETTYALCAPLGLLTMFALGHHSFTALILSLIAALAAASVLSLWSIRSYVRPVLDVQALRRVGGYTALATLNLLAAGFVVAPSRLLLAARFSNREVGVFSAYFTSSCQVSLAAATIAASVLVPLASTSEGQRYGWKQFRAWGGPAGALATALSFAAVTAGLMLFGKGYPYHAAWALAFAAAAALILLHGAASALHAASDIGGLRVSVTGSILAGAGNLALAAVLVPRYGIPGASAALLISYAAGLVYYLW